MASRILGGVVGVLVSVAGCTRKNPAACCETDAECTRLGLASDDVRACTEDGTVCVANTCMATGCDGDEDCNDPSLPFCVAGACSAGCDGNEDCVDPARPICIAGVCDIDCATAGGRFLFLSNRDGDDDVYVALADGSHATRVTTNAAFEQEPQWSRDGAQIGFRREVSAGVSDILRIDDAGGNELNITMSAALEERFEFSPNATQLVYEEGQAAFAHQVGTTMRTQLVAGSPDTKPAPTWSPDGTKVGFTTITADAIGAELHIIGSDGTGEVNLTANGLGFGTEIQLIRFSPDGRKIAFIIDASGTLDIRVIDITGANLKDLTTSVQNELDFAWSPDSTKIAFVRDNGGDREVLVMNADGAGQVNLSATPGADEHPRWSPDGAFLFFESDRDGNREIYRMRADGTEQINLTTDGAADHAPEVTTCGN